MIVTWPHLTQISEKFYMTLKVYTFSILEKCFEIKNLSSKHFKVFKNDGETLFGYCSESTGKEEKHFYILLIQTFHIFTLHPFILVFCSIVFKHTKNPSFYIFRCVHIHSKLSFYKRKFTSKLFLREKTYQMWTFFCCLH